MKDKFSLLLSISLILLFLPGCEVIAGIFKAGFFTAIILLLIIAGLGWYAYKKISGFK